MYHSGILCASMLTAPRAAETYPPKVAPPGAGTCTMRDVLSAEQFLRAQHKLRPISYIMQRPLLCYFSLYVSTCICTLAFFSPLKFMSPPPAHFHLCLLKKQFCPLKSIFNQLFFFTVTLP